MAAALPVHRQAARLTVASVPRQALQVQPAVAQARRHHLALQEVCLRVHPGTARQRRRGQLLRQVEQRHRRVRSRREAGAGAALLMRRREAQLEGLRATPLALQVLLGVRVVA